MNLLGDISNAELGLIGGLLSGGGSGSFGSSVGRALSGYGSGRAADQQIATSKNRNALLGRKAEAAINLSELQIQKLKSDGEAQKKSLLRNKQQADQFQSGLLLNDGDPLAALNGVQGLTPKEYLDFRKKIHDMKPKTPTPLEVANMDVIPDPENPGQFVLNQRKADLAKAKSTKVSVNTHSSPDKKFYEGLGKFGAARVEEAVTKAQASVGQIKTVHRIRDSLANGGLKGLKGQPTLWWLRAADALGITGDDDKATLAETQKALQAAAQLQLDAAAQMRGQGQITENERKLIAKAGSPKIFQMAPAEVVQFLDALEKVARYQIDLSQNLVGRIDPKKAGGVLDLFDVKAPAPYQPPENLLAPNPAAVGGGANPAAVVNQSADSIVKELLR